jgi:hypothetical protein
MSLSEVGGTSDKTEVEADDFVRSWGFLRLHNLAKCPINKKLT